MTVFSKNLGGMTPLFPPWLRPWPDTHLIQIEFSLVYSTSSNVVDRQINTDIGLCIVGISLTPYIKMDTT